MAQIPLTVQERIAQIRAKRFQALKNLTSTNNNSDQASEASTNFTGVPERNSASTNITSNTQSNESSIPESISKALAFTSSHFSPDIVLNERQQQAVDLAISGQSFCYRVDDRKSDDENDDRDDDLNAGGCAPGKYCV